MIGKWLSSEADAETESEAKRRGLDDILKRETPVDVAPAATNGVRVEERSEAERSSLGAFMDIMTDQVISLSLSGSVKRYKKDSEQNSSI
ncbi:hypothetical protein DY000_02042256 [Brassica cretica]|uniref:Uncharacterized protein n=1 Tax=Brassica cretica TaxID=69181 RepID=A0ABQ7BKP9_BRACR|nr:hypothetical protein DY000_02042256 [Brassica cretica]